MPIEEDGKSNPFKETKVILIGSGKGGVGKSSVTVNLAYALRNRGQRVGVMDADVYGFSVPAMMGLRGQRPEVRDEKLIEPLESGGIKVISMGSLMESEETPVIWRGPLLISLINQFIQDVVWGQLDYLLIDLPPGTGDVPLSLMQRLKDSLLLVVTTPQEAATRVAGRVAYMARALGIRSLGIVENMSYCACPSCGERFWLFGNGTTEALSRETGLPITIRIPFYPEINEAASRGAEAIGPAGEAFALLAEEVMLRT